MPSASGHRAKDVVAWILEERTLEGRLRRIRAFLENEGYRLPPPPKNVDRREEGAIHFVYGMPHTVAYAIVDREGRKIYHYREREIDHIIIQRIAKGDEWMVEYISRLPRILQEGRLVARKEGKIIYQSRRKYLHPEIGIYVPLRAIVKQGNAGQWYIDTLYPVY